MPKDYASVPREEIRYKPRVVDDDAWIQSLLRRRPTGVLATIQDDQPFVMTNLFVYDEATNAIYMHTAQIGRTRANVEQHPKAVFTVSEMGRLLPYPDPVDFDLEYASAVVFGHVTLIEDLEERRRFLHMILDKYAPHLEMGKDYNPIPESDLKRTSVYCFQIESWSGKKNAEPADFAGAYEYNESRWSGK